MVNNDDNDVNNDEHDDGPNINLCTSCLGSQNILLERNDETQHAKNGKESKMNTFVRAVLEVLFQEHLGHGYQLRLNLNLFCNDL